MVKTEPSHRRIAVAGLLAVLVAIAGCGTVKGAGRAVQDIGKGIEQDVETVEEEVSN